jgi:hypothetical protein
MSAPLIPGLILLASLSLALGYQRSPFWPGLLLIIAAGAGWLAGQGRGWAWLDSLLLVAFVSLAGLGVWLGASAGLMLLGLTAALAAWELQQARHRFAQARHIATEAVLRRAHLRRLALVSGGGLLLGSLALLLHLPLNLASALGLTALIILGLSRVVRTVRRES